MAWSSFRRRLGRLFLFGVLVVALVVTLLVAQGWRAFGQSATGARRTRMEHSKQWQRRAFENPEPLFNDALGMLTGSFHVSDDVNPKTPVPTVTLDPVALATPPPTGLRVTWLGHSTTLIEIDGHRFMTDPIFSDRISPLSWVGPRRWYAPLIELEKLPTLDAVLISHDHYDHLDQPTIEALNTKTQVRFIVPLGVGAHLEYWGVAPERIIELDWWEETKLGDLTVTCTPARHASGRQVLDKDGTLWASYAFTGPKHRVWYSGDTGLFKAMKDIGQKLGPFDLTLIEVGQYHRSWPDWHIGPEQAVKANQWVNGRTLLPIHWALLGLAFHGWTEPIERASLEAKKLGVTLALPKPGQSFEPDALPPFEPWWPTLPFETAEQHPIVSTNVE